MYLELAPKVLDWTSRLKGRGTDAHSKKLDGDHINCVVGGKRDTRTCTDWMAEIRRARPGGATGTGRSVGSADAGSFGADGTSRHVDHGAREPADLDGSQPTGRPLYCDTCS